MAVPRDVTWHLALADSEIQSRAMSSPPVDETALAPPEGAPFGAKRAFALLAAFLGIQLGVAVIVGVLLAIRGLKAGAAAAVDLRVALGAALAGTVLATLATLHLVRRAFRRPGGGALRVAFGWRRASARACARSALTGLALMAAFAIAGAVLPVRPREIGPLARAATAGGWARLCWAALAVLVAPPAEELVFRGVLYAGLARSWRPPIAGVVTTTIFVALHLTEVGGYWPGWLAIGAMGALALRVRLREGSLWPAIALHATYNAGLVLLVYAR
jgi:membrane protease YdiL (CAAX protease family)